MNCPSRVDALVDEGYNQNPNALNADATTRADMDRIANARLQRAHRIDTADGAASDIERDGQDADRNKGFALKALNGQGHVAITGNKGLASPATGLEVGGRGGGDASGGGGAGTAMEGFPQKSLAALRKYTKFIGPGFMVAVAYIDPGMPFPHWVLLFAFDRCLVGFVFFFSSSANLGGRAHVPFLEQPPICESRYDATHLDLRK